MICPRCARTLSEQSEYCDFCGYRKATNRKSSTVVRRVSPRETLSDYEDMAPRGIDYFNYGAFCYSWFWALCHKQWLIVLLYWAPRFSILGIASVIILLEKLARNSTFNNTAFIIVVVLVAVNLLYETGLRFYMGMYGNSMAWKTRHFENAEHFNAVQKVWIFVAIIHTVLAIIVTMITKLK